MPPAPKKLSAMPMKKTTGSKTQISVLDRIQPISFEDDEGIKILLYGRSGTGKTTLWATFPKPILSIVCSGSNKTGELRSINTPEYRKTISHVELRHSSEIPVLCSALEGTGQYGTIVLDHASGFQDLVLKEILGLDEMPAQKSWGLATQQQYGQCAMQVKEHLRSLLSLSCNVVIIAQERESNTDADSGSLLMPSVGAGLSPSIAGWLYTAVDYICNTFIRQQEVIKTTKIGKGEQSKTVETRVRGDGVEYCLRTGADAVYTTKFRMPKGSALPAIIIDPNYDKIMKLVNGLP